MITLIGKQQKKPTTNEKINCNKGYFQTTFPFMVIVVAAVVVVIHQGIAIANQPPGMHACRFFYGSYFYIPR